MTHFAVISPQNNINLGDLLTRVARLQSEVATWSFCIIQSETPVEKQHSTSPQKWPFAVRKRLIGTFLKCHCQLKHKV